MLGKLIKYEFKNTRAVMILICLITIIMGIPVGIHFRMFEITTIAIVPTIVFTALSVIAAIYMIVRYYKLLYTDQGYLIFTLPASVAEVVSSKIIVTCLWAIIFVISVFISTAISFPDSLINFDHPGTAKDAVMSVYYGFAFSLQIIAQLMAIFICISLGQICRKHKIICAVLCYIGIGLISIIIFLINFNIASRDSIFWDWSDVFCAANVICPIIFSVVFCVASVIITKRHLNFD